MIVISGDAADDDLTEAENSDVRPSKAKKAFKNVRGMPSSSQPQTQSRIKISLLQSMYLRIFQIPTKMQTKGSEGDTQTTGETSLDRD